MSVTHSFLIEGKDIVLRCKGVKTILDAIQTQDCNSELLELACSALYNLSSEEEGKSQILRNKGITTIMTAMNKKQDYPNVLIEAIQTLNKLYCNSEVADKIRIIEKGAPELLLSIMQRYDKHPQVHFASQSSLAFISSSSNFEFILAPKSIRSLKEMCLKYIIDNKLPLTVKLPSELLSLMDSFSKCQNCGGSFYKHSKKSDRFNHYEIKLMKHYDTFQYMLPVYCILCSIECVIRYQNLLTE
eukprot:TRINITY_DN740_c0_g1_i3.p1 TRINITY_DN740_c0_g1~~TRINITY_DN740_c0_g1_i3.p1  ORF type:complete len:244 (-),score=20.55 TRINITY_DN740_c0_g1_i3:63-794(-)